MYMRAVQRCETLCCRFSVIHLFHVSIIIGNHCMYIHLRSPNAWDLIFRDIYVFSVRLRLVCQIVNDQKLHLLSVIVPALTDQASWRCTLHRLHRFCWRVNRGKVISNFFSRKPLGRPSWWCQRQGPDKKALQLLQKFFNWERGVEEGERGRSNLAQSKKSSENARKDDRAISF